MRDSCRLSLALTAAFGLFCLFLASQIPYTHDDWDWGLAIGLEQLRTASVNSRYAGNACVVLLTRSPLLKTLVMALVFTLLPLAELRLVSRLGETGTQSPVFLLAAQLLFLLMPASIWQQSCGWVSGFCNFVLSALLLLCGHCLLFRPAKAGAHTPGVLLGAFTLAFVMQLFLENAAIYSVGVFFVFLLLRRISKRHFDGLLLALFLGSAAGLAVLFSSSVFSALFTEGQAINATRELVPNDHVGLLPWLLRCFLYYIKYFPTLWGRNTLLCCAILLLLTLLAEGKRRLGFALVNGAFALVFALTAVFGEIALSTEKRSLYLAIVLSLLYFVLVALECLLLFAGQKCLCARLLFYWVSAPLVMLPLAITTMDGGRLFFTPYVLQSVFALSLLAAVWKARPPRREGLISAALAALLLCACLQLGLCYGEIGSAYRERLALLRMPEGAVTLAELPHGERVWFPDPETRTRLGYFRAFYGVSDALTVEFASGAPFFPW